MPTALLSRVTPRSVPLLPRLAAFALAALVALAGAGAGAGEAEAAKRKQAKKPIKVLVYTATYGFRHDSITGGRDEFFRLGQRKRYDVRFSQDPSDLTRKVLKPFDVLVFLNSTGNQPWSAAQRQGMLSWLKKGKGIVSTHAAIDAGYDWSDYGDIVGGYFLSHPHTGMAPNVVEDRTSPLTRHLPERFELREEYYRLQLDPRPNVHVLASLDTDGFAGGSDYIPDQPLTWCQEIGGGRSFTTAWGHFDETYADPGLWRMLRTAVRWAAGRVEADCSPTVDRGRALEAEDADVIGNALERSSPVDGANQVVSEIEHDGYLLFRDVDLDGVKRLKVRAAPVTVPQPSPYSPPTTRPALGGRVSVVLDAMQYDGQALFGSPPDLEVVGSGEVSPASGWAEVDVPIEAQTGRRDVYLVFTNDAVGQFNAARIFAPALQEGMFLMSVDRVTFEG